MLEQTISNFIKKHSKTSAKHLIGVSGGVDSMVLLVVHKKLNIPIIVVHFNFMLRENDADLDQATVEDFCKQNDIQFFIKKGNAKFYAEENKIGIQEAAREMRYSFFREIMEKEGASKLVTAHHADDQVETILFNLLRGSGIRGLAGMPIADNDILRPMISISKEEIYTYAKENNIPFREDASNASDKYQRNFLRNNMIPQLEERFPNAKENILKSANLLSETTLVFEQRMEQIKKKLLEEKSNGNWQVPIRKLKHYEPKHTILYELFNGFGLSHNQLPELHKLIEAENGARLDLTNHTIYKDRNFLLIQSANQEAQHEVFIEKEKGSMLLQNGKFSWQLFNEPIQSAKFDKNVATLDAKTISLPFRVRPPRQGDYFYPLGMKKKKKLSRFFIDNKYSPLDKEQAVVIEMETKILWIVGERIDNRFRISENTNSHYKFTFEPNER